MGRVGARRTAGDSTSDMSSAAEVLRGALAAETARICGLRGVFRVADRVGPATVYVVILKKATGNEGKTKVKARREARQLWF